MLRELEKFIIFAIMSRKRIFWLTAGYFLDVDLPVVPSLMSYFDIDWVILTTPGNKNDDERYVRSQTDVDFTLLSDQGRFFTPSHYRVMKSIISNPDLRDYDLYYFDISDLLFLFPLIKKYLPIEKVVIATHNVTVPKGARYAPLARRTMRYILRNFRNFQTFSVNQMNALTDVQPDANVLYAPLMLKDYGGKNSAPDGVSSSSSESVDSNPPAHNPSDKVKFLFFGNIVKYKRLDVLLEAVDLLWQRGVRGFKVYICGYCPDSVWNKVYSPKIKNPSLFYLDIRRIPTDKVADYFNECHYFVMPYQDIAQSGAMTVALNYDMPIIVSDLPTFHEFLTGNGDSYFFRAADPEALADAMQRAINNSAEEYAAMRQAVKNTVEAKLSKDVIIGRYKEYLENL